MESGAASHPAKPVQDDLLILGEDVIGADQVHRALEFAVRTLGSCFSALAVVTVLLGVVWIAATFGTDSDLGVVQVVEGYVRDFLPHQAPDGVPRLLGIVAPPVLFTVIVSWLFFGIGRGLRRLSPTARWAALVSLVPACIPPLVLIFASVRVGVDTVGVCAVIGLIFPATGVLVLTASQSDFVFSPEYRSLVWPEPGPRDRLVSKVLVVLFSLGLFATIVLIASVG